MRHDPLSQPYGVLCVVDANELKAQIRALHPNGAVSRVELEGDQVVVFTARPGILIGKRGANIGVLQDKLLEWFGRSMKLQLSEIRYAETEPQLIADTVLMNLQRGVALERMEKHVKLAEKRDARVRIEIRGAKGEQVFESEGFSADDVEGIEVAADDIVVRVKVLKPPIG